MNECWKQVDRLRRQAGHVLSAHGFPSIWIWKEALGLELVVEEDYFTVSVPVAVSPQFYAWVFGFGGEVEILSPDSVREGMKQRLLQVNQLYAAEE